MKSVPVKKSASAAIHQAFGPEPNRLIPKSLAQCADLLYSTRQKRLAIEKEVEALKTFEGELREHLIQNLPRSQATGITGKIARATVVNKVVVQVKDFDAILAYVARNLKRNPGVAALIQRRVNDTTVKELWDAGREVPGVGSLQVPVVSLEKV